MWLLIAIGCAAGIVVVAAHRVKAGKIGRGEAISAGILAIATLALGLGHELVPALSVVGTLLLIVGSLLLMFQERKRTDSAK